MYPLSNIVITTPPATEPLTLDEVLLHLRVDSDDDNGLINSLIVAAREHIEKAVSRALVTRSFDFYFDQFPGIRPYLYSDVIDLPRPPLVSVTGLTFTDTANVVHPWTVSGKDLINESGTVNAHIDNINEPGRIVLAYSQVWPNNVLRTTNAVKISLTAGYGDAALVPESAKSAMKLLIGTWYDNRESVISGRGVTSVAIDNTLDMLLSPLKNWNFA